MGVSYSAAQAANKLRSFAGDLDKLSDQGLSAAALEFTGAVRRAYKGRTGGDGRLSGVGRNGARVGARFDKRGGNMVVRATGPAHLIEGDTKAHRITPKKRRASRKRAIATPYGPRSSVQHPGTRGRPTFFPTVHATTKKAARAMAAPVVGGFRETFR